MSAGNRAGEQPTIVPLSVVFLTVGMILLATVMAVWLVAPATMPGPIRTAISSRWPYSFVSAVPTPLAAVPLSEIGTKAATGSALLPETPPNDAEVAAAPVSQTTNPLAGVPTRIEMLAIDIDAPIFEVGLEQIELDGSTYHRWQVPADFAVGWHNSSAGLGKPGNTVLNGHHNIYGEVFRDIVDLQIGDEIVVHDRDQAHLYRVTEQMILEERGQPLSVRLENARWIEPTSDERITLVSCWPYADNSHRVIVVAHRVSEVN